MQPPTYLNFEERMMVLAFTKAETCTEEITSAEFQPFSSVFLCFLRLNFFKLMKKQEGRDHTWTMMPSRYVDAIPPFASCTWADNRWGITHVGGTGCAYFIRLLWGFNRCWLLLLNLDPHLFIIFEMKACQATLGDSPGLRKGPGATRDGIAAE